MDRPAHQELNHAATSLRSPYSRGKRLHAICKGFALVRVVAR